MNVTLPIPNELAAQLGAREDLTRRALEAFGVGEYQAGRLTAGELRRLLGFETRIQLDAFLKARGVFEATTLDDVKQEQQDLQRLGF